MRDKRRYFSLLQKDKLFLVYKGKCGICGNLLEDKWEADHIFPWSLGGQTVIGNGQPACISCNKKKGILFMNAREWQEKFLQSYRASYNQFYLLFAVPAAGKTFSALSAVKILLSTNEVSQVIIVCPTEFLKIQWAIAGIKNGIQLDPEYKNGLIKQDYHGICLTYSKIKHSAGILNHICAVKNTLVILDEIHHAGEQRSWGDNIVKAFEPAHKILGLTGTPFRSDNNPIPFVKYENNQAKSNFSFSYADAIKKQSGDAYPVCRMIMFPSLDGGAEYYKRGDIHQWGSFTDEDSISEHSSLLKALLLDVEGEYLTSVLREANERLDNIRENSQDDAGGLVVCMTKEHADRMAKQFEKLFGEKPLVVHSDNQDATIDIKTFKKSKDKWIIAVKMVSEGVDIPRLMVGIYATNVMKELTFRQIMGRVTRRQGEDDEWAYFYIPPASILVDFMKRMREDVFHQIDIEEKEGKCKECGSNNVSMKRIEGACLHTCNECGFEWETRCGPIPDDLFYVLGTERNPDEDIVISDDISYKMNLSLAWQKLMNDELGLPLNEWQAAKAGDLLDRAKRNMTSENLDKKPEPELESVYDKEKKLRKFVNKAAFSTASRLEGSRRTSKNAKEIVSRIHYEWSNRPNNNKQAKAGIDELERKLKWLRSGEIEREHLRYTS